MTNPVFVTYAIAASIMVLKIMLQGWITVVRMMSNQGGFGYRGYVIHTGAMLGTAMAFNVWFVIWPAQKKILGLVESLLEKGKGEALVRASRNARKKNSMSPISTPKAVPVIMCRRAKRSGKPNVSCSKLTIRISPARGAQMSEEELAALRAEGVVA